METRRIDTHINSRNWTIKIHKGTREASCEIVLGFADHGANRDSAVSLARDLALDAWIKEFGPIDMSGVCEFVVHSTVQVLYYIRQEPDYPA